MLDMQDVQCPYCGEWISLTLNADDAVQVKVRTQDDA